MPEALDIDSYIAGFPGEVQELLQKVRATICEAMPHGEETISYQIPAFALDGRVVIFFAGFKKHIGLYPPVKGDEALAKAIAPYEGPKGNLQFPLDEPIPYKLISRIAKFRVKEHAKEAKAKKQGKTRK